ncbi:substrate-binding domain-containing protein [Devosia sp. MC532]|uniref:substrate-binding domain-containing protein n=1 Tax=Devosia sp. MC532 TaxID=2799788 RepID=UPI0018F6169D|nr:substrate-binding domain-containing protein [Devosia sp. MC532]MBJ7577819.1 substrate-binding domain-containing protein [Devosia sp. MC532]
MIGIRGLADHLGLSIGTVSRALNGKPDVNDETRSRVLEAAQNLGYAPNQSGRALRKGSTNTIGFMMQTGRDISAGGDAFFMSVFDGVQSVLSQHNLDLVVLPCGSEEHPEAYLKRIVERGFVDGLIISSIRRHDARIDFLAQRHIPFIALGRSDSDAGHPWIDLDFEAMATRSVERLVRNGHKRIALFLTSEELNLNHILLDHYRASLEAAGILFDTNFVMIGSATQAGGYDLAQKAMSLIARPTAIIVLNEMMTVGTYKGLLDAGVEPGSDVAIIGRTSPHATYMSPSLTGFSLDLRDLGSGLAKGLLTQMTSHQHHYPNENKRTIWPVDLVEGDSDRGHVGP